ncbi:hypothetical protein [Xylanimonas sp. McL0601]|uniref:hypothetical protein n=1 Tax=Xylanimonas sp. McL0601 TaxID=3414739 RepID=UPI003CEE4085
MNKHGAATAVLTVALLGLTACNTPSLDVTVTNRSTQTIRIGGNCVADDPHTLEPGDSDSAYYLGAQCRIDNGDGLDGMLGCVTLATAHTDLTDADLRDPPGPDDCWGSGT